MKKYGGARTIKKKKSIASKMFTFKNTKSKEKKLQKNIRRLIERNKNDHYSYIKVLSKFKKFFKGILKLEDKISYANHDTISNFDIKKMEISEKLKDLDTKYGKLLTRIRGQSSQIYEKINEELEDDKNMNVNMNNNNDSLDIIQLYASVLEILLDLDEKAITNPNSSQEYLSNLTMVSTILCDELVKEFLEVKQDTKAIEDELVDLFKSFNIKKNNSSIENNLSKILSNIRI
uniref:Uncharacterized protein n=1 Tax=viral metagenome TaxID=1070528 RepID=A0A6C0D510_9ZZZZ